MSSQQPVEIERKFLVDVALIPRDDLRSGDEIEQGYLSLRPTVRVRTRHNHGQSRAAWITVKGPGGLVRAEYEYEIPYHHAEAMMGLCVGKIVKTRYHLWVGCHLWEVDQFHGNHDGLWLAEIELTRPDEKFMRPPWILREVTEESAYSNAALSQGGIP